MTTRRPNSKADADSRRDLPREEDEGSALVLVLALMVVAALIITPMMGYAMAVTRSNRVGESKAVRSEAVKGGLRTALADPTALYKACEGGGPNSGKDIASPMLATPVKTTCYVMSLNFAEDETKRPYGVTATQANVPLPPFFLNTDPMVPDLYKYGVYPGSGQPDPTIWHTTDTSLERIQYKIWTPNLPSHALSQRSATPYNMPIDFGACTVYFPGTYVDPITITGSTPVYFASGIYYFENSVTITGGANVVIGGGTVDGCTTDQEAAFYAENAPETHNISGLGATWVFGMTGRLRVNNTTPGDISLIFNQRYVHPTDTGSLPSATVNIMSVNGELLDSDLDNTPTDMIRAGVLSVPMSLAPTTDGSLGLATLNKYRPSTLVPPDPAIIPAPLDTDPIIDIAFSDLSTVYIEVPGYVDVPQGRFKLDIPVGSGFNANKTITFNGGVLARTFEIPGDNPAAFTMGVSEVVVQLVLLIRSETTSGVPKVVSDAIVQVNKNGGYAVNSWVVQ